MKYLVTVAAVAVVGFLLLQESGIWQDDASPERDNTKRDATLLRGADVSDDDSTPTLTGNPGGATLPGKTEKASGSPNKRTPQKKVSAKAKPKVRDPLQEKWKALGFEATTPPTTLEAMFLDGTTPITEGVGLLWKVGSMTTAGAIPAGKPATKTVPVSGDGTLRFDDLENGSWMLGVKLDDGVQRLVYIQRNTGNEPNERLLLELGNGTVFGFVYDADGQPATDAVVRIGSRGRSTVISQVQVDKNGRYRIGRLRAGSAYVSVAMQGDLDDPKQGAHREVVVPENGEVEMSFGSPRGDLSIAGVVQCIDGTPVRGPGRVIVSDEERGGFVIVHYDEKGTFAQRIAAGTYKVRVWLPSGGIGSMGLQKELFRIDHDRKDVVWILGGTRGQGRVRTSNGAEIPKDSHVVFTLMGTVANPFAGKTQYVRIHADGTYGAYGLAPGRYLVRTHMTGFEPQKITVDIEEGTRVLDRDFTVRPAEQKKLAAR